MTDMLLIYRAPAFSPNAVRRDRAIIAAIGRLLSSSGISVDYVEEEQLASSAVAGMCVTMSRTRHAIDILKGIERGGGIVLNSAFGIERCARGVLDKILRTNDIPAAPLFSPDIRYGDHNGDGCHKDNGFWLKRADMATQTKSDVQHVDDATGIAQTLTSFRQRGIHDVLITEHVVGDIVKFYGVYGTDFFRIFYPTDDGLTKFGNERFNGKAHHYAFSKDKLHSHAEQIAQLTGVKIYGGDCIVRSDGSYAIIDFNDFPSFSRCRDEAADAIVRLLMNERAHTRRETILI